MAQSWGYHFQYSLQTTSAATGIPLPAPTGLFGTYAQATRNIAAIIAALRVAADPKSITLVKLVSDASKVGILTFRAATFTEIITVAGGVAAVAYLGALVGAVIYATEQVTIGDWLDSVFDKVTAGENARALANSASQLGVVPTACGITMTCDQYRTDTAPIVPASSCSAGAQPISYAPGWPTTKANSTGF